MFLYHNIPIVMSHLPLPCSPPPSFRRVCETRKPTDVQHIRYIEPDMEDKTNCGDAVEFECEKCYESPQEMSHKCQPSKQWSGDIPTCTMSTCSVEPKSIKHCEYNNNKNDCGDKRYHIPLFCESRSLISLQRNHNIL